MEKLDVSQRTLLKNAAANLRLTVHLLDQFIRSKRQKDWYLSDIEQMQKQAQDAARNLTRIEKGSF